MRFKRVKYLIACHGGPAEVEGYAICVDSPCRFALRNTYPGWIADHWDTGLRITKIDNAVTLEAAAMKVVAFLKKKKPGEIEKGISAARQIGVCLPERNHDGR